MKKLLFFTAIILLTQVSRSSAQASASPTRMGSFYLGPVTGLGSSWVANVPGVGTSPVFSDYGGINFIYMYGKHWGWGDQMSISSEGYTANYPDTKVSDIPLYLRMPMRAYYFFGSRSDIVRPDLYLGPSVGMRVAEHTSANNYAGDVYNQGSASNFRMFDVGANGGGGIIVRVSNLVRLNFDLGYYQGLTDALKSSASGTNYTPNRNVDFNMGVLFGIK